MDQRLYVAACSGDVRALNLLLEVEPLILHTVQVDTSDTPLHIAALLGHAEFAKVVLGKTPELAKELNHKGLSPVHLASLKGYLAIVIDLLNVDKELCRLKYRDGRTPLHWAAIKGRLDVIVQLLSCCPESARELTNRSETVLHLAVKNNQCEAVVGMLDILRGLNLADELVDCKNEDGNTILHLATAMKQRKIVKILSSDVKVSINAANASQHTEIEIVEICCLESDDAEGQRACDCHVPPRTDQQEVPVVESHNATQRETSEEQNSSRSAQSPTPTPTPKGKSEKRLDSVKSGIIVLCSLFASFSFQAALNPPGGLWPDGQSGNITNIIETAKRTNITDSAVPLLGNFKLYEAFLFIGQKAQGPLLNFTDADLYGPAKAMNIALAAYDFIYFLYFDAVCFIASLATVFIVMLTTALRRFEFVAITLMTMLVLLSATWLYYSVLALITNEQFAKWAIQVGVFHLYIAGVLLTFICLLTDKKTWQKIAEILLLIITCLWTVCCFLWKVMMTMICKLYRFLRRKKR